MGDNLALSKIRHFQTTSLSVTTTSMHAHMYTYTERKKVLSLLGKVCNHVKTSHAKVTILSQIKSHQTASTRRLQAGVKSK